MDLTGEWTSYYDQITEFNQPVIQGDHLILAYFRGNKRRPHRSEYVRAGLQVLNKMNGREEWSVKEAVAPVILDDNRIIILKDNFDSFVEYTQKDQKTTLCALEIDSGQKKWAIDGNFGYLYNCMIKTQNEILLPGEGPGGAYIFAINSENGSLLWQKKCSIKIDCRMEYDPDHHLIYVPVIHDSISILNPDSGELVKEFKFYDVGNFVVGNGKVIAQTMFDEKDSGLVGIDSGKKEILWTLKGVDWYYSLPKPVINQGICYAFSMDDVIAVDINSGRILWKIKYDQDNASGLSELPLNIIDHHVYMPVLNKPEIDRLDPKTGKIMQKIMINHPIHSPFAYEAGVIYYRSKDTLYAERVEL